MSGFGLHAGHWLEMPLMAAFSSREWLRLRPQLQWYQRRGAINTLISTRLGYSQADLDLVPAGADMGLGCGNPKAIAALKPGETVVDLGSGGGFDCFLAVRKVGSSGRVIGVDMTRTWCPRRCKRLQGAV